MAMAQQMVLIGVERLHLPLGRQVHSGGGRLVVGLAKEDVHTTFLEVKMQLLAM